MRSQHVNEREGVLDKGEKTFFAPAGRAKEHVLFRLSRFALEDPVTRAILDSVSGLVMILNEQRQVLAINEELRTALGRDCADCCVGLRPGEVFGCHNASSGPDGCGTGRNCRHCGAVISILAAQASDEPTSGDCVLTVAKNKAFVSTEFKVRATPIRVGEHRLIVFVLLDDSSRNRREVLERIFLHDLMNTLGGLVGLSDLLVRGGSQEIAQKIMNLSLILGEEVKQHRLIVAAERDQLVLERSVRSVGSILDELGSIFEKHPTRDAKQLFAFADDREFVFATDHRLLVRVLVNMIKNAFEATEKGGRVGVYAEASGESVEFHVTNPGVITEEAAAQIFNRSFSTKGEPGRGIGTYCMKLFGEKFLGGAVWFDSNSEQGTVFHIRLPLG